MPVNVQELVIKIYGEADEFKSTLSDSVSATEGFNTSLLGIAAVATAAFAAVAEGIKFSLQQYKESEEASNRLTLALQNQGLYSDLLFKSYKEQAEELQRLTGIDKDQIVSGEAQLQSMIGRTAITKEMTAAAVNLGAAMGGDVKSGFEVLGRAIDGQTRGLKALGIEVDENLTREERTRQIIEKVSVAYGGLAESQNKGLGSVKGLGSAIADLAKDFGESLAPSVTTAIEAVTHFFQSLHEDSVRAKDPVVQVDKAIENVESSIENLKNASANSFANMGTEAQAAALKEANRQLDILKAKRDDLMKSSRGASVSQDPAKEREAERLDNERKAKEKRERDALLAHNAAMTAAVSDHTKEVVDLYKQEAEIESAIAEDKNKRIRGQLEDHLQIVRDMRQEALRQEGRQQEEFNTLFSGLKGEQYEMTLEQTEIFNQQQRAQLQAQILTEDTARRQAVTTELTDQIKRHNTLLVEQNKYGKAYALINSLMHSEVYEGSRKAFGDLAALQQSSNSTLKAIGKVAAIANIVMKTAEAAMNIYAGFSTIPIIGPALGIAGAAAAVAFGAEQIGDVQGAAAGALVQGGIPGVDSVPILAQQGELISPAQNFEEVVGSVAAKRLAEESGGGGGVTEIIIGFQGDAAELLEKKFLARRATGVGVL